MTLGQVVYECYHCTDAGISRRAQFGIDIGRCYVVMDVMFATDAWFGMSSGRQCQIGPYFREYTGTTPHAMIGR